MQPPKLISASMLYNHLACPHRVAMDAFGDWSRRDPVSPFVEMLWARGNSYEAQVVDGLGEPFVDLSGLAGEEKETATRAAIAAGEALIYNGRLSDGGLLGEPDLLRREGDGYVAIDIKSGAGEEGGDEDEPGKLKKTYGVQIALYTDLLDRLGVSAGRYGYILDVHGEEVRYDLDAPLSKRDPEDTMWSRYLEARLEVARLLLHREAASQPALASVCKLCVWRSACLSEVKAADDLTLLPELGRTRRDALKDAFPTVHALAKANVAGHVRGKRTDFRGIGPDTLKRLQARAKLAVTPAARPYFRDRVALPSARQELFFDIETDPLRDFCYLHGFLLRENGDAATERFVAFFAEPETAQAEREAFAAAWAFIQEHAEAVVVYYSKYERTVYRDLQAKYPEVCGSGEIEALFAAVPERSFDLYYDAVKKSEWPTMDYSVKTLAKFCGFQWRDADPSGASSIQWFDAWVRTRDPAIKQRILDYNEDDCVAMRVVLDRMRGMRVGG
jgi:predicted RecB family nuclease